jgi:hypothetical protein
MGIDGADVITGDDINRATKGITNATMVTNAAIVFKFTVATM